MKYDSISFRQQLSVSGYFKFFRDIRLVIMERHIEHRIIEKNKFLIFHISLGKNYTFVQCFG